MPNETTNEQPGPSALEAACQRVRERNTQPKPEFYDGRTFLERVRDAGMTREKAEAKPDAK